MPQWISRGSDVDNQMDVDSDSSSDNELLEVVRAPRMGGRNHRQ